MLTKARLWLARLLLPRGYYVAAVELWLAKRVEMTKEQFDALYEFKRDNEPRANTLGQDDIAPPVGGIGGCGPLNGPRSPSHWDRDDAAPGGGA